MLAGMTALAWPFLAPALRRHCLPYVPASDAQVRNVIAALRLPPGAASTVRSGPRRFVDLGSGDGRIVLAAGQTGLHGVGYELNPWLVLYSTWRSRALGLSATTSFRVKDLWKADLSRFDDVVVFGVAEMVCWCAGLASSHVVLSMVSYSHCLVPNGVYMANAVIWQMSELQGKLSKELQPGARVVACRFPIAGLQPDATFGEGIDTVWVYTTDAIGQIRGPG